MDDDEGLIEPGEDEDRTAIISLAELHGASRTQRDRYLLIRIQGTQVGQVVALHGREWKVGRARDADLWLGDSGVSRHHARIVWQKDGYVVEDLESANGTYVSGRRIERQALNDGDVLQFGPSAVFRYSVTDGDQETMLQQLYDASVTDSLTGAYNREHFDMRLESEISFARRHSTPVSLLLFDIDHFKRVNDTFGHQAGDAVLVEMAAAVTASLRAEDILARYGGEEFTIILRGIDVENAAHVGERFRVLVQTLRIEFGANVIPITISVGVASLACCGEEASGEVLVAVADRRLYAAKHQGRNRVIWQG